MLLACLAAGCEVPRPDGSYDVAPRPERGPSDAPADGEDEVYAGSDSEDDFGLGGMPGGAGPAVAGADGGPGAAPLTDAQMLEAALVGDYYMRSDVYASTASEGRAIDTDATAYSLVKVGFDASDHKLKMIDWQCQVSIVQRCTAGCSAPSTIVRDKGGQAYLPAKRTLTVDATSGAWSVDRCAYALGWKWDFSKDANGVVPTDDGDPLLYDPDGGGLGINSTLRVTIPVGPVISNTVCNFRLAQKIDVTYSGTLKDGAFDTGAMQDTGSEQQFLDDDGCAGKSTASTRQPSSVRLVTAPKGKAFSGAFPWQCPSLSEFQQVLRAP